MKVDRCLIVLCAVLLFCPTGARSQTVTPTTQSTADAAFTAVVDAVTNLRGSYDTTASQNAQLQSQNATQAAAIANLSNQLVAMQGQVPGGLAPVAAAGFSLIVPMPADVVYTPVKQYCIATPPEGSDQNSGTKAAPFATIGRALQQVFADRSSGVIPPASAAAIAEISFKGGEKFTQNNSPNITQDHLLFDSYGWGSAEIDSSGTPFQRTPNSPVKPVGLHLQYLDLVSTVKGALSYGLMVNQVNDVSVDYCSFSGFTFNIAAVWQTDGLRLAYNYSERASGLPGSESGSGFFVDQATNVQCYGNFHYHEGWDEKVYSPAWWADVTSATPTAAAGALLQNLFFFHGEYWRDDIAYAPADTGFSFYVDSACTGLQIRTGGTNAWSIYQSNGNSADCFSAAMQGGFDHLALFGETFESFPFWGEGIILQAANNTCRHVRALSQSKMTQNALIEVKPPNVQLPATQPGTVPTTQAVIDDVTGVWPVNNPKLYPAPAAVWIDPTLTATTTATNITIRAPRPGEHVLSLLDIYGVPNDQSLAALFKANFRNWRADLRFTAQYVWDQADKWVVANP